VHLPYVEVKLTFYETKTDLWSLWINKIDKALSEITVVRDFADVAKKVSEKLVDLKSKLEEAISTQNFEEAIKYRDLIKKTESK
jgi:protein-arginine kinase activator protein McsA